MEENIIMVPGSGTKVIVRDVKQEIETAFLDYSMSVIVARALPDVRDGLKQIRRYRRCGAWLVPPPRRCVGL